MITPVETPEKTETDFASLFASLDQERLLEYVAATYRPEEVYCEEPLTDWAERNRWWKS